MHRSPLSPEGENAAIASVFRWEFDMTLTEGGAMKRERRRSARILVGRVTARVENRRPRSSVVPFIPVVDMNADGASVLVPESCGDSLEGPFRFCLENGHEVISSVTTRWAASGNAPGICQVGLSFDRVDVERQRALAVYLARQARAGRKRTDSGLRMNLVQRERIARLLRLRLLEECAALRFIDGDTNRVVGQGKAIAISGGPVPALGVAADTELPDDRAVAVEFFGPYAAYSFQSVFSRENGILECPIPAVVTVRGFRSSPRVAPPRKLTLALRRARLEGRILHKEIHDISLRGFSFIADPTSDPIFLGEQFSAEIEDGRYSANVIVRSVVPREDCYVIGCEMAWFSRTLDEECWNELVFSACHPRAELADGASARTAWSLLESSGYIEETTPALRDYLERVFEGSWRRAWPRSGLNRFILTKHGGRPVGTMATSLLYPETWMLHHAGIDAAARRSNDVLKAEACRDMFVGVLQHLQQVDGCNYLSVFSDANKPFNQKVYRDFAAQYPGEEDLRIDDFDIYKCDPSKLQSASDLEGLDVHVLQDDEASVRALSSWLAQTLHPVRWEALALQPEQISLKSYSEHHAKQGSLRKRTIFSAVQEGAVVATLLCDVGQSGVNIFSLLNTCWFTIFSQDVRPPVLCRLIDEALGFYRAHQVREMLLMEPVGDETGIDWPSRGFNGAIRGMHYICRRRVLAPWIAYLHDLFGASNAITRLDGGVSEDSPLQDAIHEIV